MDHPYDRLTLDLKLRQLRPQTVEKYLRCVRAFEAFGDARPLEQRDRDDIRAWLLHLIEERALAASTYLVHLAALRFLYRTTLDLPEVVARVPTPIRRPPGPPRVLSPEQIVRLFDAAPTPTARLVFQAAYDTGLRLGELCRLQRSDVHEGLVTVHDGKGGRPRVVRSGARLARAIQESVSPGPWLFPARVWPARRLTWADRPVAARTVSRWFRVAVADAELPPDARFHGLRHAFASHLHAAGADLSALQAALGHRSLATTARYVHRSPAALRRTPSPLDLLPE